MFQLSRDDFQHIAPRPKTPKKAAIWDGYVTAFTSAEGAALFERYGVTTRLRLCHALAQWSGAETDGFSILYESGAYSVNGLLRVFGAPHHSSPVSYEEAVHLCSLPIYDDGSGPRADAIFERVYGYQTHIGPGMGNVNPGDGARFRGMGPNQATGRWQWTHAAEKIGCSLDELTQPLNLLHMALIEWQEKGCNSYADQDDCVSIRKLINCGTTRVSIAAVNGLPEARAALRLAKNVITDADFATSVATVAPSESNPVQIVDDVPGDTPRMTPNNEDQPDTLMQSREAQTAVAMHIVPGSGLTVDGVMDAFTQTMATHPATTSDFVMSLMWTVCTNKIFLAGVLVTVGGVFSLAMRRWRYYVHGV